MTKILGSCCNGGRAGGAETVYEVDWTALATQSIGSDGPVDIDGTTWSAVNVANASVFRIVNGVGLEIQTTGGTAREWNGPGSQVDSPAMLLSLDAVRLLARPDVVVEVWHYFSAVDLPTAANCVNAGWWGPETPYSNVMAGTGFARDSGGSAVPMQQRGTTRSAQVEPSGLDDVVVARYVQDGLLDTWSAAWSGDWPTRESLNGVVGHDVDGYGYSLTVLGILRRPIGSADQSSFVVTPTTNTASAGDPSFTLSRSRFVRYALA